MRRKVVVIDISYPDNYEIQEFLDKALGSDELPDDGQRVKVYEDLKEPFVDIVFDGPPGPESGRFVEVNHPTGHSVGCGKWIDQGKDLVALRINVSDIIKAQAD